MKVRTAGGTGSSHPIRVLRAAPAIFTGSDGQPAIYHADGKLVSSAHPIVAGETITILATGLGVVSPPVSAGDAGPRDPLSTAIEPPTLKLGQETLDVVFAGLMPGSIGIYQVNARVPQSLVGASGASLTISQGERAY
jgi:uncharacterized protein (TIGR03437 family)